MVDRHGGGIGLRDQGLIESALNRPLSAFGGQLQYGTPFHRAAVLWLELVKNHGFVDANKRTATMAMQRWLDREGFFLEAPDEDLTSLVVAIADERASTEELAGWLESHSRPVEPP